MALTTNATLQSYALKAGQYGAEEALETATALALMGGRTELMTGITADIKNDFAKEVIQDGIGAAYNVMTQGVMMFEQAVLETAFNKFAAASTAIIVKSKIRLGDKLRGLKGRKAKILSKVLGGFDKLDVDHARLIADYGAMSLQARNVINTPRSQTEALKMQQSADGVELNKEQVRLRMAGMAQNSMRNSFDMKLKLSKFTQDDEKLIKSVTGLRLVTQDDISKLNAMSGDTVFRDSAGNWLGGVQVQGELMTGIRLQRV